MNPNMHPNTANLLRSFEQVSVTPEQQEKIDAIRESMTREAHYFATIIEGPEATVAIRKLMEAKDAAIRGVIFGE